MVGRASFCHWVEFASWIKVSAEGVACAKAFFFSLSFSFWLKTWFYHFFKSAS
uniref:Uncharacterized protein n=1 Tax=Anguilla anguilla TaxID=7936 RepID=A0A0E9WKI8_ANGAN